MGGFGCMNDIHKFDTSWSNTSQSSLLLILSPLCQKLQHTVGGGNKYQSHRKYILYLLHIVPVGFPIVKFRTNFLLFWLYANFSVQNLHQQLGLLSFISIILGSDYISSCFPVFIFKLSAPALHFFSAVFDLACFTICLEVVSVC